MKDQQDSSELHSLVNLHLKQLRVKYLYPDDIAAPCIESKTRTNFPEMNLRISSWENEEPDERSLCFVLSVPDWNNNVPIGILTLYCSR